MLRWQLVKGTARAAIQEVLMSQDPVPLWQTARCTNTQHRPGGYRVLGMSYCSCFFQAAEPWNCHQMVGGTSLCVTALPLFTGHSLPDCGKFPFVSLWGCPHLQYQTCWTESICCCLLRFTAVGSLDRQLAVPLKTLCGQHHGLQGQDQISSTITICLLSEHIAWMSSPRKSSLVRHFQAPLRPFGHALIVPTKYPAEPGSWQQSSCIHKWMSMEIVSLKALHRHTSIQYLNNNILPVFHLTEGLNKWICIPPLYCSHNLLGWRSYLNSSLNISILQLHTELTQHHSQFHTQQRCRGTLEDDGVLHWRLWE